MSFPDDWWTTGLEDEPCYGCGVTPSKHGGHGYYTCQTCYEARWCPTCKYELRSCHIQGVHVCPTPEERAEYEKQSREMFDAIGMPYPED